MTLPILLLVATPWLAAAPQTGMVEAMPEPSRVSNQVRCSINAEKDAGGTRLSAVISAGGPVSGTYTFRVQPQDGGAPLIDQKGDFEITGSGPSEVKQASLDLPAGEGYSAALSVRWPNGSSSCSVAGS